MIRISNMLARMIIALGRRGVMVMSNHFDGSGSSRKDRFVAVNTTEDGRVTDGYIASEEGNEENTVVDGSAARNSGIEEDEADDDSVEVEGNGWNAEPHIIEDYFV